MYAVEDTTFKQARDIVAALARELDRQKEARSRRPVDLHELVRRAANAVPEGGEAAYISSVAADLGKLFSIEEMSPRKRRAGR